MLIFNKTVLLEKHILETRKHFIENNNNCIDDVKRGSVVVNDPDKYIMDLLKENKKIKSGGYDHNFTYMQHTYYLQTGDSIALLP